MDLGRIIHFLNFLLILHLPCRRGNSLPGADGQGAGTEEEGACKRWGFGKTPKHRFAILFLARTHTHTHNHTRTHTHTHNTHTHTPYTCTHTHHTHTYTLTRSTKFFLAAAAQKHSDEIQALNSEILDLRQTEESASQRKETLAEQIKALQQKKAEMERGECVCVDVIHFSKKAGQKKKKTETIYYLCKVDVNEPAS